MTTVYLGYPPENVKNWILAHKEGSEPTEKRETMFYFVGGSSKEESIEGTLDQNWMIDKGYYDTEDSSWMKRITKAEIGTGVTSIGTEAFAWCYEMRDVIIPSSVTSIGQGAFSSCNLLESVTIPSSVMSIGMSAFAECNDLTIHVPNQAIKTLVEDSGFEGTIIVD